MDDPTDSRRLWIPVGVIGILAGLAAWRALVAPASIGGDASAYLAHAWALVEGRAYADTGYLFRPEVWTVGPPLQPPGLPLLLAPLLAVFGRYSVAPTVLMHVLFAAFLAAAFRRLARTEPIVDAAGATLLGGVALILLDVPSRVGSDLGYMTLVWVTILIADRWADRPEGGGSVRDRVLATVSGGVAFTFRLAAIPLVPAAALWAAIGGRRDRARWAWLGTAVVWGIVFAALYVGFGFGRTPGTALDTTPTRVDMGGRTVEVGALGRVAYNASLYRYAVLEALLYPLPSGPANRAYHVFALLLAAIGGGSWLWTARRTFLASFVAATVAFLLVAPVAEGRYLWVLYPVIALALVRGLRLLAERILRRPDGARRAPAVVPLILVALVGLAAVRRARVLHSPQAADSQQVLWQWAGEIVREDVGGAGLAVVSNRPRNLAWFADVPASFVSPADTSDLARLAPTHLVFDRRAFEADGPRGAAFPSPEALGTVIGERGPLVVIRRGP